MRKILLIVFLGTIAVIIGLLNWWAAPTMSDDIMYRFVWQPDWQEPFERIESLGDVIKSQLVHYEYVNGRSITHTMAQILLNLLPEHIAKLLNAAMFFILFLLIRQFVGKSEANSLGTITIAFGLLFLVISGFNGGFVWLLGSVVYLWALVMTLAFLLMLRWLGKRDMTLKLLPLLPLSFLLGWSHEAISLPLSLTLLFYIIRNRKGALTRAMTYCTIAYTAGALMILLSPALWLRADADGIPFSMRMLSGCLNLYSARISLLLSLSLIIYFFKNRKQFYDFVLRQQYLLIAWLLALGIIFVCGTTLDRVPICADFLAMLVLLRLWQGVWLNRYRYLLACLTTILSIAVAIPAISMNYENYQNYLYHRQQLEHTHNTIIKTRQLPATMSIVSRKIAQRYVFPTVEFSFYNCYMAFDPSDSNNKALSALTGRNSVILLPEDVVNNIYNHPEAYRSYAKDEHGHLFIQQLPDKKAESVTFILGDEVPIMLYQRLLSYRGFEYELDSFHFEQLTINNGKYMVMTVPPSNISRRIKDINIK